MTTARTTALGTSATVLSIETAIASQIRSIGSVAIRW
jgi:hypothetical protein